MVPPVDKTSNLSRELEKAREKARHDEATALKSERLKGIAEGRLEGLADGKNEKASEIANSLIKLGMPSSQIAEITGLPLDKVNQLHSSL